MLLVPERRLVVGAARRHHRRLGAAGPGAAQQRGAGLRRHADQRLRRALGARPRARPRHRRARSSDCARETAGFAVLNLDLRDTQRAAIRLYESLGYRRWGTHPGLCPGRRPRSMPGPLSTTSCLGGRAERPAVILYPGDRPQGRRLRAPAARRDGAAPPCSTTIPAAQAQRLRRRRLRAGCTSSISTAPSPAARSTATRCAAIRAAVDLRIQLGGGIRDRAAIEHWLGARHRPRRARHRGVARSRAGAQARCRPIPAGSSSASTRATAGSRSRAGPRRSEIGGARAGAAASRMPASPRSSTPTSTRDGALAGVDAAATAALARAARRCR